jgi:1-deoxy-D-xylulose-5-phosphate synthase
MHLLEQINSPADLKALKPEQLPVLAGEIRQRIIEVTSANGGHIGPNLGVVELTIALHRQFSTPGDKILFDVSHQAYVHKLLTGRNGPEFDRIRQTGGLCGFMSRDESPHDAYGAGHAGTALSAALGMAVARDLKGETHHVVAVVGDAAFTCGITMEALNNIAEKTKHLIIVLNDNEWSIDRNVGAIASYFNQLITTPFYNRMDRKMGRFFSASKSGRAFLKVAGRWKKGTKDFLVSSSLFETYGVRYLGPLDGHDIAKIERYLAFAKECDQPVILHLLTKKGKGYEPALAAPEKFHGTPPFDITTGKREPTPDAAPTYQDTFGQALLRYAQADSRIVGITAAMPPGTGLVHLRSKLPRQYFDVGIAEEHAVIFAAGMAAQGIKPVVAIYSTFLQRAFDCVMHDVCLQNLPVVFCMDRAGLSPTDGPTHHGLFDIAFIRALPHAVLMQPRDEDELADMLWTALGTPSPTFIRYPKGCGTGRPVKDKPAMLELGRAEVLREGREVQFWALGPWVENALRLADRLRAERGIDAGVVNARFVKPLDRELLIKQAREARLIVTLEDHQASGGFGSAVLETLSAAGLHTPVHVVGWPDRFVHHASDAEELRRQCGLGEASIFAGVTALLDGEK